MSRVAIVASLGATLFWMLSPTLGEGFDRDGTSQFIDRNAQWFRGETAGSGLRFEVGGHPD